VSLPTGLGGPLMIRSATIKNFRCFESVSLKDCKTLNVVLGSNASGKTSLLESILMTLSNGPAAASTFRQWRGLQSMGASTDINVDRAIWGDIFYRLDTNQTIEMDFVGDGEHQRSLKVVYGKAFTPMQVGPNQIAQASPICFSYERPGQPLTEVRAVPMPNPVGMETWFWMNAETVNSSVMLLTGGASVNPNTVQQFSQLKVTRAATTIIDEMKKEFPFIRTIDVAAPQNISAIFAEVSNKFPMIPIGQVSSGVSKIFAALTSIASMGGGVVLIDEIENGIYYDRYGALWRSIYEFAKLSNVQIFASTHSKECLEGLATASEKWMNDVSFIRATKTDCGSTLEQFHGSSMFDAMRIGEIR
jgi:hypothetical protein